MTIRDKHARLLEQAAAYLDPLDVTSPAPMVCLQPAYAAMLEAFRGTESYASTSDRGKIRFGLLAVSNTMKILKAGRALPAGEIAYLHDMARTLRVTSDRIRAKRAPTPRSIQTARVGLKLHGLSELADSKPFIVQPALLNAEPVVTVIANDAQSALQSADVMRSKLPTRLRNGEKFTIAKMPILAYAGSLRDSELSRMGMKYVRIPDSSARKEPGVMHNKLIGDRHDSLLLLDQLVVGVERVPKMQAVIENVVKSISNRLGEHVNPMVGASTYLASPGNHLTWVWMVPAHAINMGFKVDGAAFPWMSKASPERVGVDRDRLKLELTRLEKQQETLERHHRTLDQSDLRRIDQLRQALSVPVAEEDSPEKKRERLAALRQELEDRMKKENAKLISDIEEMADVLSGMKKKPNEDPATKKQRTVLTKRLADARARLEAAREVLIQKLRKRA